MILVRFHVSENQQQRPTKKKRKKKTCKLKKKNAANQTMKSVAYKLERSERQQMLMMMMNMNIWAHNFPFNIAFNLLIAFAPRDGTRPKKTKRK